MQPRCRYSDARFRARLLKQCQASAFGPGPTHAASADSLRLRSQYLRLRDPDAAELPWPAVEARIRELVTDGTGRGDVLDTEAATEPLVKARERWAAVAA